MLPWQRLILSGKSGGLKTNFEGLWWQGCHCVIIKKMQIVEVLLFINPQRGASAGALQED